MVRFGLKRGLCRQRTQCNCGWLCVCVCPPLHYTVRMISFRFFFLIKTPVWVLFRFVTNPFIYKKLSSGFVMFALK